MKIFCILLSREYAIYTRNRTGATLTVSFKLRLV